MGRRAEPRAPENDSKALRDIWFDKISERLRDLFINGTLHDRIDELGRHGGAAYVAAGREPLVADYKDIQRIVDETTQEERGRLELLGLTTNGKISPLQLAEEDVSVDKLFSKEARTQLLARPNGPTTEDGMRYAMYMATEFMYQQLHGNNSSAIDDPNTGLRFMNDLATYEIFWHFIYLTVLHGAELTADGKYSKAGERVTPELFMKLLDERRETVKALFEKLGTTYEDTDADSRSNSQAPGGPTTTRQPSRRIAGSVRSRVLLSLIEQSTRKREAILERFHKSRGELWLLQRAAAARQGYRPGRALRRARLRLLRLRVRGRCRASSCSSSCAHSPPSRCSASAVVEARHRSPAATAVLFGQFRFVSLHSGVHASVCSLLCSCSVSGSVLVRCSAFAVLERRIANRERRAANVEQRTSNSEPNLNTNREART